MQEKNRGAPVDHSKPLKNKNHELFCINLLSMRRSEAYTKAGYKSKGDNARKAAERLLSTNVDVLRRFEYLKNKHNMELEEKGFISREKMLSDALHMKNICLGKVPTKLVAKHKEHQFIEGPDGQIAKDYHEYFTEEEKFIYDIRSFTPLWDKLMNALDYYPKVEEKINIDDPVYLAKIFKKMPKDKLKEFMEEFKKTD